MDQSRLALFLMVGQSAEKVIRADPTIAPSESLLIAPTMDLSGMMPEVVKQAFRAAEAYKLFFVFEGYLRELVVEVLSKTTPLGNWWDKVPEDVQGEVLSLEQTEEMKRWMALGSRDKSLLMTFPQLLKVIEHNWKSDFQDLLRDRGLVNEARLISHLRNTICHMSAISDEEVQRVKQVIRDWFRMVAP